MDHHCPWVGSCVGITNHKLFVQFLIYTTTGCAYGALKGALSLYTLWDDVPVDDRRLLCLAVYVALGLTTTIGKLLVTHTYYTFTSKCFVEMEVLDEFNPFFQTYQNEQLNYESNLKSDVHWRRVFNFSRVNFYQVFGTNPYYWFLPI